MSITSNARSDETTDEDGVKPADRCAALKLAKDGAEVLRKLGQRVHPAWIASLGAEVESRACQNPKLLNNLLLSRFDLRWPDISAASHGIEQLWLLPPSDIRRLCCARALYSLRDALNRCVIASVRRAARLLVGETAFHIMTARPTMRPQTARLPMNLDPDWICTIGWRQLKSELPWRDARVRRITELMLPPAPLGFATEPNGANDFTHFVADLPVMYPEHSWLFGSGAVTTR